MGIPRSMNKVSRLGLLFLASGTAWAESAFVELFNGKNLDGWTELKSTGSFCVDQGAIVGTATHKVGTSFLRTNEEYGDFELEFECRLIDPELNSGVQIRSRIRKLPRKDTGPLEGPQVDISGKSPERGTFSGNIYGQGWGEWLTPKDERRHHTLLVGGAWNRFRILAEGNKVTTWINGGEVVATTIPSVRHATHPSGYIALQLHAIHEGTGPFQVAWRNLRVRKLAASPESSVAPAVEKIPEKKEPRVVPDVEASPALPAKKASGRATEGVRPLIGRQSELDSVDEERGCVGVAWRKPGEAGPHASGAGPMIATSRTSDADALPLTSETRARPSHDA